MARGREQCSLAKGMKAELTNCERSSAVACQQSLMPLWLASACTSCMTSACISSMLCCCPAQLHCFFLTMRSLKMAMIGYQLAMQW